MTVDQDQLMSFIHSSPTRREGQFLRPSLSGTEPHRGGRAVDHPDVT
jgi:hypothetical protein